MADREKVIKELQRMADVINQYVDMLSVDNVDSWVILDALDLLKEQKAKCLTKDELVELHEQQFVWVEGQVGYLYCVRIVGICAGENGVTDIQFDTPSSFVEFSTTIYGMSYRIWTAEPTDEQRRAVKWK